MVATTGLVLRAPRLTHDDRISNGLMGPDQARLTLGLPPKATRDQTMAADRMTQLNRAIETLRRIEDPSGPRSSRRCRSRWLR